MASANSRRINSGQSRSQVPRDGYGDLLQEREIDCEPQEERLVQGLPIPAFDPFMRNVTGETNRACCAALIGSPPGSAYDGLPQVRKRIPSIIACAYSRGVILRPAGTSTSIGPVAPGQGSS